MISCTMPGCQTTVGCQCQNRAGVSDWLGQIRRDASILNVANPAFAAGRLAGLREAAEVFKEPAGVLCYIGYGRAWFTTMPLDKQWGDDWDDAPYEHNAGSPYRENGFSLSSVPFDAGDLVTPDYGVTNSRWSVKDINAGKTPWLRSPYEDSTIRIMAGATFAEFQDALVKAGGTALTPWPRAAILAIAEKQEQ